MAPVLANRPTLYEILRIPASASAAELCVAFKLRDLELKTAGVLSGGGGWHCPATPCDETLSETAQLTFTGTWGGGIGGFGNGWFSKGSFTGNLISQSGAVSLFNYRYSGPMETFTSRPQPVPEPSTLLMLGSSILGLAGVIRRKLTR